MNRILQLQQDKTAALTQAGEILNKAKAENRALSAEERTSFEAHTKAVEDISATLTAEEKFATMTNIHSDQRGSVQAGHDNALDKPWGPEARAGETKAQRQARIKLGFGEYLSEVKNATLKQMNGGKGDPRLYALNEGFEKRAAAAGASEAVPSDGGFLIHPDFSNEILQLSHDTGLIYPFARKLPLNEFTNAIKIPAVDERSRADGYRWGGVQMFWENEAQSLTSSKPTFSLLELVTKKLTGLYYATNEVLADSRLLGAVVLQAFGEEMGFKLDDGVIRGTGAGQLSGVLNAPCLITVAKETGQATQTVVFENIKKMWGRMWNRSRKNAVWFINQDIEQQLYGLSQVVGTGGVPVYLPPGANVFGAASGDPLVGDQNDGGYGTVSGRLFGRPVIVVEQCSTLGTLGDILLADFSQYLMVDKGDMQAATSMHVRFVTDEQTFRWIYRTDGQPWWKQSLTPANGTNTLSPFVALATR